jgi:hypothetical protein
VKFAAARLTGTQGGQMSNCFFLTLVMNRDIDRPLDECVLVFVFSKRMKAAKTSWLIKESSKYKK